MHITPVQFMDAISMELTDFLLVKQKKVHFNSGVSDLKFKTITKYAADEASFYFPKGMD